MVQQWFALVDACVKPAQCMSYLCMVREALVTAPNGKHGEVLVSKAQFIAMLFLDYPTTVVRVCVQPESQHWSIVRIELHACTMPWSSGK